MVDFNSDLFDADGNRRVEECNCDEGYRCNLLDHEEEEAYYSRLYEMGALDPIPDYVMAWNEKQELMGRSIRF